jgi:membrane protein CcdC involved in cytochrome C biogenesis
MDKLNPHTLSLVIPVLVILPILYLRLSRMMKPQRLKLNRLWLRPVIMIVAAGTLLAASPPQLSDGVWFALAALLGIVGGWHWGKLTELTLHPEDGTVMSKGSQAGMIVLVLLLVFRIGMKAEVGMEAQMLHVRGAMLTDVLIIFTALLFSTQGLEIFLRAQRLMKAAS